MRILQVVTLLSPDAAYGGPVRVAINQARALQRLGHEVCLAAAVRGYDSPPAVENSVPLVLFPAYTALPGTGFAGLVAPGLLRWMHRNVRDFDVVHVHLARDLVTLPAALMSRRKRVPYVVQTHGMIDRSDHPLSVPLDAAFTRRALRGAYRVFYLTDKEALDLEEVCPTRLRKERLVNGASPQSHSYAGLTERPTVLFLARLHRRKRPQRFVDAALRLIEEGVQADFLVIGPDEGEGRFLQAMIDNAGTPAALHLVGPLPHQEAMNQLSRASLYVLPSVQEPYPMTVLEALSLGVPSIVTSTCGLASTIRQGSCGYVVEDDVDELTSAIRVALSDERMLRRMSANARSTVSRQNSIASVARVLDERYREAAKRESGSAKRA